MTKSAAVLAACCVISGIAIPGLADAPLLRAGDKLTYTVSLQSQQQVVTVSKNTEHHKTLSSSGALGTALFEIVSVDADGTAHGMLTVRVTGYEGEQLLAIHTAVPVTVTPDGAIVAAQSVDPLLDQFLSLAGQSIGDLAARDLAKAAAWQWKLVAPQASVTYTLDRRVHGQATVAGFPTYAVQTTGDMDEAADDSAKTSASIAGTFYYDQRDRLFIGETLRTDTSFLDKAAGGRLDTSAFVTIALRALERAGPQPSPSETPAAQQSPTPTPAALYGNPVPTVTPGSPVPIATPGIPAPTVTPSKT